MLGAPCGLVPVCIPVDLSSHDLQKRIRALSHRRTHGAAGMFENTSTSVLESTGNETNQKSSQKSKSSWTQIKRRCGTVVGERFLNHQNNIQAIHWYSQPVDAVKGVFSSELTLTGITAGMLRKYWSRKR